MLTIKDLPAGFKQVPTPSNAGVTATGPNATCTDLAGLMFSDTMRGGAFEVDRDFANRAGVRITESIVPYATTEAAAAAVKQFGVDISYCPSLFVAIHGLGAQFALATAPAPSVGSQSYAMRMTARNGKASLILWSTVVLDGANVVVVNAPTQAGANILTARAVRKLRASNLG